MNTKMMERVALLAAIALLTACGGGVGGGGGAATGFPIAGGSTPATMVEEQKQWGEVKPPPPTVVPSCSVAFWGDSISGMTAPHLGSGLQVQLRGIVGGTAAATVPTFLQDQLDARFVVLEYGTNDSNAKTLFEMPMRSMLDWIKAKGRTPVVVGLSSATQGDMAYRAVNNMKAGQLAKEYGALFVDWASVPWAPSDLMADGVHPAGAYQQRLADLMTKVIVDAAPECGQSEAIAEEGGRE